MTEFFIAVGVLIGIMAFVYLFEQLPSSGDGVDWEYRDRHRRW